MNLGAVMAVSNKKVILLDLDMRKPKVNLPAAIGRQIKRCKHDTNWKRFMEGMFGQNRHWQILIIYLPVHILQIHLNYC